MIRKMRQILGVISNLCCKTFLGYLSLILLSLSSLASSFVDSDGRVAAN